MGGQHCKPVPLASVGGFQPSRILNNLALQLAAQEFRDRPACRALSGAVNEVQGVLGEEAALLCEKRPQDNVRPAAGKTVGTCCGRTLIRLSLRQLPGMPFGLRRQARPKGSVRQ